MGFLRFNRRSGPATIIIASLFLIFGFQNCGIERPRLDNRQLASVFFDHANISGDCASCHGVGKPQNPYTKNPSLPPHRIVDSRDCVGCHAAGTPPTAWSNGNFGHLPMPNSCTACHESKRPAPVGGQVHGGGGDCVNCHSSTKDWKQGSSANHTPPPSQCLTCHGAGKPQDPYVKNPSLPPHRATDGRDCVSCHVPGTVMDDWKRANFTHTPTPTACAVCHESKRPAPVGGQPHGNGADCVGCHKNTSDWKMGATYNHQPPPTQCSSCHGSGAGYDPFVRNPSFPAHRPVGGMDCIACHSPGTVMNDWNNGNFPHSPMPTSCTTCHEQQRPAPQNGQPHGGGGDCVSCHKSAVAWNQGVTLHSPAPTECKSCHGASKTYDPYKKDPSLPTHRPTDGRDCIGCHATGTVIADWHNKANFAHSPVPTSCNVCHQQQRPSVARYPNGSTVSGHYSAKDCYVCHISTTTSFVFGHSNAVNSNINFCLPCHDAQGRAKHGSSHPEYFTANNGDGRCYDCHNRRRSWDH